MLANVSMLTAFIGYFCILFGIGIYFYFQQQDSADFALGGRKINYWFTALSAQASDMSDWLFMAFPGVIYLHGLSEIWIAVGLMLFMFLSWHAIAPRLRQRSEKTHTLTLSSLLSHSFTKPSNLFVFLAGMITLYFFVFYIAAGLIGLGKVFQVAFQLPYHTGVIISLIVIMAYTSLGGMLAIAFSDFIQGLFLLAMLIYVPLYATTHLGGIQALAHNITAHAPTYFHILPQAGMLSFISTILAILSWGIGYFGQPHILINFMGINDPKKISKAKIVGVSWQILALGFATYVGVVGKALLPKLANHELVFVQMVKELFSPWFAGIILCAVLAATISTINTQSLVSASIISQDLYPMIQPKKGDSVSWLTRISVIIVPCLALCIAWNEHYSVLDSVLYAWSGLGSVFGPLVLLSLYTNRITQTGALAGLISTFGIAVFWPAQATGVPTLVAGYICNIAVTMIISHMTKKSLPAPLKS